MLSYGSSLLMTNIAFPDIVCTIWGWFLTSLIIISLVATWIQVMPSALSEFKNNFVQFIKRCRRKFNKSYFKKNLKRNKANSLVVKKNINILVPNHAENPIKNNAKKVCHSIRMVNENIN